MLDCFEVEVVDFEVEVADFEVRADNFVGGEKLDLTARPWQLNKKQKKK